MQQFVSRLLPCILFVYYPYLLKFAFLNSSLCQIYVSFFDLILSNIVNPSHIGNLITYSIFLLWSAYFELYLLLSWRFVKKVMKFFEKSVSSHLLEFEVRSLKIVCTTLPPHTTKVLYTPLSPMHSKTFCQQRLEIISVVCAKNIRHLQSMADQSEHGHRRALKLGGLWAFCLN